jgi:hypothetical protein
MTRPHEVSQLTTAELEVARRQLRANLGLITPGSPAHAPILAHMQAIDAELAGRAASRQPGGDQRHDSAVLPGPHSPPGGPGPRDARAPGPRGA